MRQKLLSAVALAALLVVAGCVGGVGSGASGQETAATDETTSGATTAGTTGAETVTASAETLPPGVSERGVENATALVRAHTSALSETGYAFVMVANGSSVRGDGTIRSNTTTNGTVAANASRFLLHSRSDRSHGNGSTVSASDVWANESVVLYRVQQGDRTQYQRLNRSTGFMTASNYDSRLSGSTLVASALKTGNFTVESVERGENGTLTTLVATGPNRSVLGGAGATTAESATSGTTTAGRAAPDLNVTAYDARIVVDERGRVRELDMSIAVERGDRTSETVDYHYELTRIGNVTVPKPDWTGDALNASRSAGGAGATTVTATADAENATDAAGTTATETTAATN